MSSLPQGLSVGELEDRINNLRALLVKELWPQELPEISGESAMPLDELHARLLELANRVVVPRGMPSRMSAQLHAAAKELHDKMVQVGLSDPAHARLGRVLQDIETYRAANPEYVWRAVVK